MKYVFAGALVRFTDYEREVTVEGNNLSECLSGLVNSCPDIAPVLFDNAGNIRQTHQVFINGKQLDSAYYGCQESRKNLPITESDVVYVLTAVAGG